MSSNIKFPDHYIDPTAKGREWHLDFVQAAWEEWNKCGHNCLYSAREKYRQITEYMMGIQRIDPYKPKMGVDERSNEAWNSFDWRVLALVSKPVRVCMGILDKQKYKIGFQPVDSLATDEKNKYFAEIKTKMMLREQIEKVAGDQAPELIASLGLQRLSEEPGNQEELEMHAMYTYKHVSATEMEQDTQSVLQANKIDYLRKKVRKNLFYYGIAGYKDYIDTNGALKVRSVRPSHLIVSPCTESDFSDMVYIGEVIEMTISEYAQADPTADKSFLVNLANKAQQKYGTFYNSWDDAKNHKIQVVDLEFSTYTDTSYKSYGNKYGNRRFVKQKHGRMADSDGGNRNKYTRRRIKVIHKVKWVVSTDHIFNYGLCTDMKRAKAQLSDVVPNYHVIAPDFYDMQIKSIGEQLLPVIDQIQLDWLRWQKFKSNAKGIGIDMEIGAMEDVNFGKGGEAMTPRELYDLYEEKWTVMWRRKGRGGKDDNFRPINTLNHGNMVAEAMQWYDSIQANIQLLRDIIGLNDFTDASTPDPKALTTPATLAQVGTSNSLYGLIDAEAELLKRLSGSIVIRLQDMEKMGMLDKYALSLGDNSINFIRESPMVSHHDYAIKVTEVLSDEEKQVLIADAKSMFGGDMVSFEDVVMVKNTDDLKVAEMLLSYRIKARKKEHLEETLMIQEHNSQMQAQAGVVAEKARQSTENIKGGWNVKEAEVNKEATIGAAKIRSGADIDKEIIKTSKDMSISERNLENSSKTG